MRQITDSTIDNIIDLYSSGHSITKLQSLVGVERHTIAIILKRSGIEIRKPGNYRIGRPHPVSTIDKMKSAHKGRIPVCAGHNKLTPEVHIYNMVASRAKSKNWEFNLTLEVISGLIRSPCAYCGELPNKPCRFRIKEPLNGIDRVNSSKGYTVDNCVTCCPICNQMKSNIPQDVFLKKTNQIANNIKGVK